MNKQILIALIVLVALFAAWLSIDKSPYTENSEEVSSSFRAFQAADISTAEKIELAKGDSKAELQKRNGQWVIASMFGYPADEEKVERMIESADALPAGEEIGRYAAAHENFEVDKKAGGVIRFNGAGGTDLGTLTVGKTVPGGGIGTTKVFLRVSDEDPTYKVETNLRSDASLYGDKVEGKNYLQKEVFKLAEDMEVQSVRISRPEQEDLLVERRVREVPVEGSGDGADKKDGDAEAEAKEPDTKKEPYFVVTSGAETHEVGSSEKYVATGLLDTRPKTLSVDDGVEPKDLAEYGLSPAQLTVVLTYRKKDTEDAEPQALTLSFGSARADEEGKDEGYYFVLDAADQQGRVYLVGTYKYDGWDKKLDDFLPKPEEPEEPEASENTDGEAGESEETADGVEEPPVEESGSEAAPETAPETSESKPAEAPEANAEAAK